MYTGPISVKIKNVHQKQIPNRGLWVRKIKSSQLVLLWFLYKCARLQNRIIIPTTKGPWSGSFRQTRLCLFPLSSSAPTSRGKASPASKTQLSPKCSLSRPEWCPTAFGARHEYQSHITGRGRGCADKITAQHFVSHKSLKSGKSLDDDRIIIFQTQAWWIKACQGLTLIWMSSGAKTQNSKH